MARRLLVSRRPIWGPNAVIAMQLEGMFFLFLTLQRCIDPNPARTPPLLVLPPCPPPAVCLFLSKALQTVCLAMAEVAREALFTDMPLFPSPHKGRQQSLPPLAAVLVLAYEASNVGRCLNFTITACLGLILHKSHFFQSPSILFPLLIDLCR